MIKFIEGFFHKHVRLRCDGGSGKQSEKHGGRSGEFETTPKHSSASNPAERAIQAVEERSRAIRADCQMRFGSSETFGADKPIWAWLMRHAGWQISRYKPKGKGMTAHKQAYGEHYTHELVLSAEIVLVRVPKPTHRGLQGGERWHNAWRSRVFANDLTIGTVSPKRCSISRLNEWFTVGRTGWYHRGQKIAKLKLFHFEVIFGN